MRFSFVYSRLACAFIFCCFICPPLHVLGQANGETTKTVDLDTYQATVQGQIRSEWTAVPNVSFGGCTCTFTIASGGAMTGLTIKDSSGVKEFDQSCLDAIGRASPFNPIPKEASSIAVSAHFDVGGGERNVNIDIKPAPSFIVMANTLADAQATSGSAAPAGSTNPVDLSPYITAAKGKVEKTWTPPLSSAGLVSCAITIGPLGNVTNINVIPSFGTTNFNDSASDAIAKCDPFAQLPPGVNSLSLMVTFEKSGQSKKVDAVQN